MNAAINNTINNVAKAIGDPIAQLNVDENVAPPQNADAFYSILDKLTDPQAVKAKENFETAQSSSFVSILKYSALLTLIFIIFSLPQVQTLLSSVFKDSYTKIIAQALTFFILTVILIKLSK